jgi:branched-chain amino acid transport system substrate-binding protein
VQPGQIEFTDLVATFEDRGIGVVFYGGYTAEAGLLVRQAKARLPELAFVVPDGVGSDDFWLIAGAAAEGIRITSYMDASRQPVAADVVAEFQAGGTAPIGSELYAYAAVQAWAQAVEKAGTTDPARVAEGLRQQQFDTVLGTIGFDAKGDVTGYEPFEWYIWRGGQYAPAEPVELVSKAAALQDARAASSGLLATVYIPLRLSTFATPGRLRASGVLLRSPALVDARAGVP